MRTILLSFALLMTCLISCGSSGAKEKQNEADKTTEVQKEKSGEVVIMDKNMFLTNVFDYENSQEWQYKGDKPAIIDLYADWCGPCRMVAPIMKSLAKEYDGKVVIYKVDVDKERELAALFNATSIPLFVFIPMDGEPQLMRGAADKATYKRAIDSFLLGIEE